MANTETPVEQPSLINEKPAVPPVEPTPEEKLYPQEPKPAAPEKPDEPAKTEEPKPETTEEKTEGEPSKPSPDPKAGTVDYENLKLPEGSLLSANELADVKKEAKEGNLSLDEAQGILEVKNDAVKSFLSRQNEALVKARKDWKASWSKDPDFGGDKLAESTELAKRAWDKLADNELKTLADQAGFGDHPAVLRMMARIGKMFSEDTLVRGSLGNAPKAKLPEEVLYGATTPPSEKEPMS